MSLNLSICLSLRCRRYLHLHLRLNLCLGLRLGLSLGLCRLSLCLGMGLNLSGILFGRQGLTLSHCGACPSWQFVWSYRQAAVLRFCSGHRSDRFAIGTETVRSVETCLLGEKRIISIKGNATKRGNDEGTYLDKILAFRLLHQRL